MEPLACPLQGRERSRTTFSFTLRLPLVQSGLPDEGADTHSPFIGNLKILYVEDLMPNQMVMKAMCKPMDVDLTIVSSGKEAIHACSHADFDMILMDIQMPEMDGYETLTALQELERFEQSRPMSYAFTAHGGIEQLDKFKKAGFDGVLTKPLTPQQLQSILAKYPNHERFDQN